MGAEALMPGRTSTPLDSAAAQPASGPTFDWYGGGIFRSGFATPSNLQAVPQYDARITRTNVLLGVAGLAVLGYLAHKHLGRGGKKR
jgi:hypothetical protein